MQNNAVTVDRLNTQTGMRMVLHPTWVVSENLGSWLVVLLLYQ